MNFNVLNATNITISTMAQAPGQATQSWSALSNTAGFFNVTGINSTFAGVFQITVVTYNITGDMNATYTGPILPPLPKEAILGVGGMPGLIGGAIYVQQAGTIRLNAYNTTGG